MYAILILSAVFSVVAIALAIHGGRIDKKMDEVSLYRVASSLVVASILAGVICFFAIFYSLSGTGAAVISSQDAIVDILGVLVTVLMGWNIISLVDFKKKLMRLSISNMTSKMLLAVICSLILTVMLKR